MVPPPGFRLNAPQITDDESITSHDDEMPGNGGFGNTGMERPSNLSLTQGSDAWNTNPSVEAPKLDAEKSGTGTTGDNDEGDTYISSGPATTATSIPLLKCLILVGTFVSLLLIGLIATVAVTLGGDTETTTVILPPSSAPVAPTNPPEPTSSPTAMPTGAPTSTGPTVEPRNTLERVYQRGHLLCGVSTSQAGFSVVDLDSGEREGMDVEMCRAIAAGIFGDAEDRVEYVLGTAYDRFDQLASGACDVMLRTTTHTMERATAEPTTGEGFAFSIPYLYNGLQFGGMPPYVHCADNLTVSEGDCFDTRICILDGTTHVDKTLELIPDVKLVSVVSSEYLYTSFLSGHCNVIAGEQFDIAESIVDEYGYDGEYELGAQIHSKEPLSMVTRNDDPLWSDYVNWVLETLISAENSYLGAESATLIPGTTVFDYGVVGGTFAKVFQDIVATVGNYGDVYERTLESILPRPAPDKINRGNSGVMYAFPFGDLDSAEVTGLVPGGTLETIVNRGYLRCGINNRVIFALFDSATNTWDGFDIDFCKAVSAAIFNGTTDTVEYTDLAASQRFQALLDGEVDVLSRLTTINLARDVRESSVGVGFSFSQPNFFDGLTFGGVPPFAGCADDLDTTSSSCQDLTICVIEGTTFETRLEDLFPSRFLLPSASFQDMIESLNSGDCNVVAGGVVDVALTSVRNGGFAGSYETGKKRFSREPLGLVTRQDDPEWARFVYWVVASIVYAEEQGITAETAHELMPTVSLFGSQFLGMFQDAVGAVGNYGEIYVRQAENEVPRAGPNEVNVGLTGPQFYPMPGVV
eukprot:Nitzschia sp. Nitz4//scaffold238_size30058//11696//14318//NITZ4_008000-RA/size30058-augustus-gene-0.16-mRNA-1//-1//CDS//3329543531//5107//frame0